MSFDEQPDGDIHGECAANYSAEGEEFPPVPTQLLWMLDGIDRKEATKMMHDYAASAIAWKPSAALRAAWERAQQAEDKARRLEDQCDACRPYLKEGETAAECLARNRNDIARLLGKWGTEKMVTAKLRTALNEIVCLNPEKISDAYVIAGEALGSSSGPLDCLHINQGSKDAAADAYETEYAAAHPGLSAENR